MPENAPAVPHLSDAFVNEQTSRADELEHRAGMLDREGKVREADQSRAFASMIRGTLGDAKAVAGYVPSKAPPPTQTAEDRRYGIQAETPISRHDWPTPSEHADAAQIEKLATALSRARLGPDLQRTVLRDLAAAAPTPESHTGLKDSLERAGLDLDDAVDAVTKMIGSAVPVGRLSAYSILQLAIHARHLRRAGRL